MIDTGLNIFSVLFIITWSYINRWDVHGHVCQKSSKRKTQYPGSILNRNLKWMTRRKARLYRHSKKSKQWSESKQYQKLCKKEWSSSTKSERSQLKRLWHFSSSVNSFFKRTCAVIQWGWMSDFCSDPSSTSIVHVCEQRRLWRACRCAGSPEPSLVACAISTKISCAGSKVCCIVTANKKIRF